MKTFVALVIAAAASAQTPAPQPNAAAAGNAETGKKPSGRKTPRIAELERQIDQRDETIRLLNEALSRALDELSMLNEAA